MFSLTFWRLLVASLAITLSLPAAAASQITYFHADALGSVVMESNEAGQVVYQREYRPYGEPTLDPPKDGPGYTGHVMDSATGLTYMQQRYYDPQIGRFLGPDPIEADSNTGSNFNRYKYGGNNPYKYIDPDGRGERWNAFVAGWDQGMADEMYEGSPNVDHMRQLDGWETFGYSLGNMYFRGALYAASGGLTNASVPGGQMSKTLVPPMGATRPSASAPQGYLYRGVHATHPALAAAKQGRVVPGNVNGQVSAEAHNLGGQSANSPLTSWSRDRAVAATHAAKNGPGGVLLRVPVGAPPRGATWSWEWSPDAWGESEVLMRGTRSGVEVLK